MIKYVIKKSAVLRDPECDVVSRSQETSNGSPFEVDQCEENAMPPEIAGRALSLLARWAIRRARKEGRWGPVGLGEVVTVDFSKGSGNGISDN